MEEPKPNEILHTITSDLVITTDVDDLVDLVKTKKEISMSDAAKQLKVSLATIEAWAGFLEEEGIISVKYKLTTPYLVEKTAEPKAEEKTELETTEKISTKRFKKSKPELKPIEINLELTKGLNDLLEKAYEFIEKGDFESAQHVYSMIKQNYEGLPTNFIEMKKELETNLTKLNKDMSINLHRASAKQANLLSKLISSELRRIKFSLIKKDIKKAESIFKEVEELYSRFPDGFVIQKTHLQNNILDTYQTLVKHKNHLITRYIETKTSEIEILVQEIKTDLNERHIDKAFENYEELRKIYNKIPKGFLQDHPQLEREILQLSLVLVSNKQELSAKKVAENTQKIKSLLISTKDLLNKNLVEEADKQYQQLKGLYTELPAGFLKTKVDLEEQILDLHKEITRRLNQQHITTLGVGTQKINSMIKKAKEHLKIGETEIAESIHREIEHNYTSLPQGFLQHNTALRVQILDLYREILLKSDESVLKEFDEAADKKYKQLVHLIVKAHQFIEESQFEIFESEYEKIKQIYGNLPFSLVEQNTKLRQEVSKLQNLVDMYKKAKQLDENKNNPMELNLLLKQTSNLYNTLMSVCVGDENLFTFVRQKLDYYTTPQPLSRSQPVMPKTSTPQLVKNLLSQAEYHLNKNNLDLAQDLFKRVLNLEPNNPIAKSGQSMIEYQNKPLEARDIYQKSISNVKSQQETRTLTRVETPLQLYPKRTKQTPMVIKQTKKIEHQTKQAPIREIHTKSLEDLYKDAKKYYEQKDYYHATKLFREIKKQDPNFKDVQKMLHNSTREQDKDELREMLKEIKAEHKKLEEPTTLTQVQEPKLETKTQPSVDRKKERLNMLTNIKLKKAKEFAEQNRLQEAISTLNSILEINPDSTEAKQILMQITSAKKENKAQRLNTPITA